MLLYRFPSCRSIRILMIRMSGPDPGTLLGRLLPQEADLRCVFVGVVGVSATGVDSLVGGDVSTSRQETDGDLMCCNTNNCNLRGEIFKIKETKAKEKKESALNAASVK